MGDTAETPMEFTKKMVDELEARAPKQPPAGYSKQVLTKVWKQLDRDNNGSITVSDLLKNEPYVQVCPTYSHCTDLDG